MISGKKLAIAFAVALPLVVLGAGIAMAADEIPGLKAGDGATAPSFSATNVAEVSSPVSVNDDCTGPCTSGTGECDRSGDCDGPGDCVSSSTCTSDSAGCGSSDAKSYSENLTSSSTCAGRCPR